MRAPRFLVDENLSVKLPEVAHQHGFEATHVVHLGLGEWKDWNILEVVEKDGWVLVTNNAVEFRSRYRAIKLHPGVIFLGSSRTRVSDFHPFSTIYLVLLKPWACGQRSCVVHMSTAMLHFCVAEFASRSCLAHIWQEKPKKESEC